MHLITLQLTGPASTLLNPAHVHELLESHLEPADRVEHLRVRSTPGQVDLAVFLLAGDGPAAERAARAVCGRAIGRSPALAGWTLSAADPLIM